MFTHAESFIVYTQVGQEQSCFPIAVSQIKPAAFFTLFFIGGGIVQYLKIHGVSFVRIFGFECFDCSAAIAFAAAVFVNRKEKRYAMSSYSTTAMKPTKVSSSGSARKSSSVCRKIQSTL